MDYAEGPTLSLKISKNGTMMAAAEIIRRRLVGIYERIGAAIRMSLRVVIKMKLTEHPRIKEGRIHAGHSEKFFHAARNTNP
jgi:hypothetical protein